MKIKGFKDTIDWYDKNSSQYAKATEGRGSDEQIQEFSELLENNDKALDAGCAAGSDSKKLTDKGLKIIGIDLSRELLKIAREKFPELEFKEADFRNLLFEDNSFHGIWAHASLLHLETVEDVKKSLLEFNRVLKTNGVIHILVKAKTGKAKTAVVKDSLSKHNRFFQYFSKEEIRKLLVSSEFSIIKIEQYREIDRNPEGRPEV